MSKPIEISYVWSKELFVEASRATYEFELRHSPKRFLGWFFIALTQFGVVGALKKDAYGLLLISTILVIYWYALRWPIRKMLIAKTYEAQTEKNHHFSMQAREDGIEVDGTLLVWEDIKEGVSLEGGFLLFYAQKFLYIPKDAFESRDEKDRFSHLVKEHVAQYRKEQ